MKKFLSLLLALVMAATILTGCGTQNSGSAAGEDAAQTADKKEKVVIGRRAAAVGRGGIILLHGPDILQQHYMGILTRTTTMSSARGIYTRRWKKRSMFRGGALTWSKNSWTGTALRRRISC